MLIVVAGMSETLPRILLANKKPGTKSAIEVIVVSRSNSTEEVKSVIAPFLICRDGEIGWRRVKVVVAPYVEILLTTSLTQF